MEHTRESHAVKEARGPHFPHENGDPGSPFSRVSPKFYDTSPVKVYGGEKAKCVN